MQRLLVGTDGSPPARSALQWAGDLAARADLELVVARVRDDDAVTPQDVARACRDEIDVAASRTLVLDGDPTEALLACADDQDADLLVVGERGTGGLTHVHLGSVAHGLAHHTRRPLALVPPDEQGPVHHLVVGVDGSDASLRALDAATALGTALGIGLTVVHAVEPLESPAEPEDGGDWEERAAEEVRRWVAPVRAADVAVDVDIAPAFDPATAIAEAVEAHAGAIPVVGVDDPLGHGRPHLGRVALHLVHHTGTAVMLVPETDRA